MNGFSYGDAYDGSGGHGGGMDADDNDGQDNMLMMGGPGGMMGGVGGQSLDEIVNQNSQMIRRQSMPQQFGGNPSGMSAADMRRISMMDYGSASPADLGGFQYDNTGGMPPQSHRRLTHQNSHDGRELSLNTSNFANNAQNYNAMMAQNSPYGVPNDMSQSNALDISMKSPFLDTSVGMGMDFGNDGSAMGNAAMPQMNMYNQAQFNQPVMQSPMNVGSGHATPSTGGGMSAHGSGESSMHSQYSHQNGGDPNARQFSGMQNPDINAARSHNMNQMGKNAQVQRAQGLQRNLSRSHGPNPNMNQIQNPNQNQSPARNQNRNRNWNPNSAQNQGRTPNANRTPNRFDSQDSNANANTSSEQFDGQPTNQMSFPRDNNSTDPRNSTRRLPDVNSNEYNPNSQNYPWQPPKLGWPSTMNGNPHSQSVDLRGVYASSGFDMLSVLARVANRKNPQIDIGTVDLSCAFVVCDAEKDDCPIVYCSDNFERLTGYTKHMILGRNCRFLQSPDGIVVSGVPRKYVDDKSVLYLKKMIMESRESQISLINYRRGGQPFMNLLTIVPITMTDEHATVKYFVGFQVDLVDQPQAVTNRNPDGSYTINYQRDMMPRYIHNAPENTPNHPDLGQTISADDVASMLTEMDRADGREHLNRAWDKVLLENTDDVIHVLSLKGVFQWISPSCQKILEYEAGELIGTALSSVCHPSDIVPVTRELKDTSAGSAVNIVFRIRRKASGYMWFEGNGSLHTEQGKGRKSIIMVGRERPVYSLSRTEINSCGGIGENELWTKLSTSGMFLFVSSNVRSLLDRYPEDLVGISIQSMMRPPSKLEFNRILEHARRGARASVRHEMVNRRGQVLSAFTTLYPGDAVEGQKPTFVVAQTRLLRHPRGISNMTAAAANSVTLPSVSRGDTASSSDTPHSDRSNMTPAHATNVGGDVQTLLPNSGDGLSMIKPASDLTPNAGALNSSMGPPSMFSKSSHGSSPHPQFVGTDGSAMTHAGQHGLAVGKQDLSLASDDNLFDELKTTKSSSWQYEIRQLERSNRVLAEEVQSLIAAKKKRKRRKGTGNMQKDCANCHTRNTPEWRRGPSGQRDLCNSCGLRWAKLVSLLQTSTETCILVLTKSSLHSKVVLHHAAHQQRSRPAIPSPRKTLAPHSHRPKATPASPASIAPTTPKLLPTKPTAAATALSRSSGAGRTRKAAVSREAAVSTAARTSKSPTAAAAAPQFPRSRRNIPMLPKAASPPRLANTPRPQASPRRSRTLLLRGKAMLPVATASLVRPSPMNLRRWQAPVIRPWRVATLQHGTERRWRMRLMRTIRWIEPGMGGIFFRNHIISLHFDNEVSRITRN
jgi:PAS domain S-box-containing protein